MGVLVISVIGDQGEPIDGATVNIRHPTWSLACTPVSFETESFSTDKSGTIEFAVPVVTLCPTELQITASKSGLFYDSKNAVIPAGWHAGIIDISLHLEADPLAWIKTGWQQIVGPYEWIGAAIIITIIAVIALVVYGFLRKPATIIKEGGAVIRQVGKEVG